MSAEQWIVQAQDASGDWYQVGLGYDDARIAKKRADDHAREARRLSPVAGPRNFRVVPSREGVR